MKNKNIKKKQFKPVYEVIEPVARKIKNVNDKEKLNQMRQTVSVPHHRKHNETPLFITRIRALFRISQFRLEFIFDETLPPRPCSKFFYTPFFSKKKKHKSHKIDAHL